MKFILGILLITIIISPAYTQDFSNKGKDFWLAYPGHIDGNNSRMALYISSDVSTSGTVFINGTTIPFTVTANQATVVQIFPAIHPVINPQSEGIGAGKGIHITSQLPVVVYAHILNAARSGSSLILPTNTLGREYVASSYKSSNNSNSSAPNGSPSGSQFTIVAVEDNTTVEIVPTVADAGNVRTAGTKFTVTLNQGDVYQYRSTFNTDITGTIISSTSTGTNTCKPIAVFSGSTWTSLECTGASGGDNLFQQLMPKSAWGKNYVTAPFANRQYDIFRIIVSDPSTVVNLNGANLPASGLINNTYYQFTSSTPNSIVSDKPVMVAQYMISQTCDTRNNGSTGANAPYPGDPEMVIINPIEQTVNDVTVVSAKRDLTPPNTNILKHFFTIIMKSNATSTLRIDGLMPQAAFIPIGTSEYSYLHEDVTASTLTNPSHRITADSGFIALAYGLGNVESYGYNAGTNVRDLYQYITIKNQYATVNFPATCKNSPFEFAITLPYRATSLSWDFSSNPNLIPNAVVSNNNPVPNDSLIKDGKQIYIYKLPGNYTFSAIGTYPVKVTATNPTPDGCSGTQEINYNVEVYDPPIIKWNANHSGCVTDAVQFMDATDGNGRPAIKWNWDFGDNTIDSVKNPLKKYSAGGTYNVKLQAITDVGCIADITKPITITTAPIAKFSVSTPMCAAKAITFSDMSLPPPEGTIVKWIWDFGDGITETLSASSNPTHVYLAGVFNVTLKVESNTGCQSILFTQQVTVNPNPVADFGMPQVCLPAGVGQFSDASTIADGSQSQFAYLWNFGDTASGNLNTSTLQNPLHNYNNTGPFNINLQVTSKDGCISDTTKVLSTIYPQPKADFIVKAENCLNDTTYFTDQSNGQGSTVTTWFWDFGDGQTSALQNPSHRYTSAGTFSVSLYIKTDKGCLSDTIKKQVIINSLPTASFATSTPACETKDVTFTNASAAGSGVLITWNWNMGDGTLFTKSNDNPFTHTYASANNYTAALTVESDKGCKSPVLQKQITVYPQPQPGFISPDVCLADAFAQFTDTSKVASGSITSWSWDFGDPSSGTLNTSSLQNPKHKYNSVGVYNVTLTITTNNGCIATITKPFTVNGAVPKANFVILNSSGLCSNTNVEIQNTSTVDFGNITKVEIYWDVANAPSIVETDYTPAPNKIYNHLYTNFQTPLIKTFQVKFRSYSGNICVDEITKTITLNAAPSVQFLPLSDTCFNIDPFAITQASETGGVPGTGIYSGKGITPGTNIFNPAVSGVGTHTIRYTFTSNTGCIDFKDQTITISPIVNVNAGPDRTVLEAATITLEPTVTGNALQYLWTPNQYLNDNTILNPVVTGVQDITYTLQVTGTGGCMFSDQVNIKVLKFPNIPNTFTPNNDGINDTWIIQHLSDYPNVRVQVFNRYGQMVFESKGYNTPWDGTLGGMNGKTLPFGTYYYVIEPGNGRKPVTGYVTLIK